MIKQVNKTEGVAAPVMRFYNMNEAAALWGLTYWELYAMVRDGRVKPYVGIGRGYKFDGSEMGKAELERL